MARAATAALAALFSFASAVRQDSRLGTDDQGPVDLFDDPFGDLMPPVNNNPNLRQTDQDALRLHTNEERVLASESLLTDQVELREEEQMEVLCAHNGLRDSSSYDAEQDNEAREERDVREWIPTNAEHRCLRLAMQNKYVPGKLLGLSKSYVPVPAFPESLGELVIEAVTHTDKGSKKHIVLEVKGCSSCENDQTKTVEWAGLLPLNEAGDPTGLKTSSGGDATEPLVESETSSMFSRSFPRQFSFSATKSRDQKYVKRHTYKYSSYHFDEVVESEALELATLAEDQKVDAPFLEEHKEAAVKLMEDLKKQVKHIPFNHKMEQMHMIIRACDLKQNKLACGDKPQEMIMLHDGGLVVSSANSLLFDELGRSTGQQCSYGTCLDSNGRELFMDLKGVKYSFTMCNKCGHSQCPSTRTAPHQSLPEQNWFNCIVERAYQSSGYIDLVQQAENDLLSSTARSGHGFLYRGTGSPGHVEGHINWHISIPPQKHCEPILQDALYVGIGVDEADRCNEKGGVDVDIGIVLISCHRVEGSNTLGNTDQGRCRYYDHLNYAKKSVRSENGRSPFYGISGDNRGGEGEGDDEWVFVDLAKAKEKGVTHVVMMANIFGCARGQPAGGPLQWGELEGAFMRVTASGITEKQFTAAETVSYVDLDEMRGGANAGAAVFMAYLGGEDKLAVAPKVKDDNRVDAAAQDHLAWKLVALKQPIPGKYLSQSFSHVAKLLYNRVIEVSSERDLAEQSAEMTLTDTLATGQVVSQREPDNSIRQAEWTGDLQDVLDLGISEDRSEPLPNESRDQKVAREMSPEDFDKLFSTYLPAGAPGTDSYCMK